MHHASVERRTHLECSDRISEVSRERGTAVLQVCLQGAPERQHRRDRDHLTDAQVVPSANQNRSSGTFRVGGGALLSIIPITDPTTPTHAGLEEQATGGTWVPRHRDGGYMRAYLQFQAVEGRNSADDGAVQLHPEEGFLVQRPTDPQNETPGPMILVRAAIALPCNVV